MIQVKELSKRYMIKEAYGRRTPLDAVRQASFTLADGTGYALVGESGSGKSTLARMLAGIERPSGGEIWLGDRNLAALKGRELRLARAEFQMVLQNSRSALDPRRTIYESIAEPIRCLVPAGKQQERKSIHELAEKVQLPVQLLGRLPHELSGGQQQRACIARALSVAPQFIVFDESVSGLDVTVRKQILDLILRLKREERSIFLFITHDIDVALYMAENIFVMKEGVIVEQIANAGSYADFTHEYSRTLIEALPPKTVFR
ncbi:MAG: nickel transporter ATP-binding protein [Paenibacillaceae bacterium]|jgi:ABC-type glutathione transport system ATPase component|nr:nickel transporter ATP-binding protein [Paenibacillaceae bacterium]